VGLGEFRDPLPGELSQGMRQRVALARTFSLRSRFIMLDEPFGALDALTKITLQDRLVELWEQISGSTVVLVTHDLAEAAALSDRVIVMSPRPGRIVADVPVDLPRPRNVRALHAMDGFQKLVAGLWETLDAAS
ncbi:MAG: ATP-binding cassette domain-containing protein, partial [Gammaproteobacteria bacterium]|nr:ATP-binding cassette domain-containing protein [Gammaproteobacteria bacterium]